MKDLEPKEVALCGLEPRTMTPAQQRPVAFMVQRQRERTKEAFQTYLVALAYLHAIEATYDEKQTPIAGPALCDRCAAEVREDNFAWNERAVDHLGRIHREHCDRPYCDELEGVTWRMRDGCPEAIEGLQIRTPGNVCGDEAIG